MKYRAIARASTTIVVLILLGFGFGCGSDGPVAPTPPPVEIPKPPPPEIPEPETPEAPEPKPPKPPTPKPSPPEAPKPPAPQPDPPETPDPDPPMPPPPEPPEPPAPEPPEPEPPEPPPETPKPKPPKPKPSPPEPPPEPETPEPEPEPEPDYTITCACDDVRVGDVIVLRVEHPEIAGTGHLTYHWAATPGSDPVPGNSPTPRWNPSGSGRVEITVWVTGDIGTVVFSRFVEVTANPAPPPSPPPPPPDPEPEPEPPPPPPPPPAKTKPWGAWSASSDSTVYGVAAGKASPDDANRAARADCQSKGGWGCAAGRPFQNQCVAVAHGLVTLHDPPRAPYPSSYYQIYSSLDEQTKRAAEQAAMYLCVRGAGPLGSGTECKILASICQP